MTATTMHGSITSVIVIALTMGAAALGVPQSSKASIITSGCSSADSCTLGELAAGGSIKIGSFLFSDWSIVNNSFNLNRLSIGQLGYGTPDDYQMHLLPEPIELSVGTTGSPISKSLTFDYLVTDLAGVITGIRSNFAYRSISGFSWDSPWVRQNTYFGTTQGGADLGSATSYYSLTSNTTTGLIDITDTSSLWVRTNFALHTNYGFARLGYYNSTAGSAYIATFDHEEITDIPEPGSLGLIAMGLAVAMGYGYRRRRAP
ncbi:MAG: PEP-CTERM sorting domain-containing protein [Sulfuritalea sp.]|nr:PEP-CTERM sorting domain-containing protein [Sulfuritalea sp.]